MRAKDQSKLFPPQFGAPEPFSRETEVLSIDFFGSLRLIYISLNYRKKSSLRACFPRILGALPSFHDGKSLDTPNGRIRKFVVFFVNNPNLSHFGTGLREFSCSTDGARKRKRPKKGGGEPSLALSKREEAVLDGIMVHADECLTSLSTEERRRVVRCLEGLTLLKLGISEGART